jgi:vancomycin permeability regulator SanA
VRTKLKKIIIIVIAAVLSVCLLLGVTVLGISSFVKCRSTPYVLSPEQSSELERVDCVIVLGCLVKSDGTPSDMLSDRLSRGVELYELGVSEKLLMSGDHGTEEYDEVNAMKKFAVDRGVAAEDVFMDHAGFSTYESMYRAKEIFGAQRVVIVTQGYHLYRAVYIARSLGLDAYGVASDLRSYRGQYMRVLREILARVKDAYTSAVKPLPTYLGESISLDGDGGVAAG